MDKTFNFEAALYENQDQIGSGPLQINDMTLEAALERIPTIIMQEWPQGGNPKAKRAIALTLLSVIMVVTDVKPLLVVPS